jgi:hypothetical protein
MTKRAWVVLAVGALVLAVYLLRLDHIVGIVGHPAGMRVPADQGGVRDLSPRCAFWVLEL